MCGPLFQKTEATGNIQDIRCQYIKHYNLQPILSHHGVRTQPQAVLRPYRKSVLWQQSALCWQQTSPCGESLAKKAVGSLDCGRFQMEWEDVEQSLSTSTACSGSWRALGSMSALQVCLKTVLSPVWTYCEPDTHQTLISLHKHPLSTYWGPDLRPTLAQEDKQY